MEKSMIQDLDYMRTSMGYKNTFTTSFHDGGFELKKSKISNLPSHKKSDLSIKLPFVVVFQTMEIQRLSQQIQALRVALKDSERQAFNCQSYEIQIRELTDQCHEYDVQLSEYKEEIEKLNMISQKLYEELEQWKQKYQNFDPMITQKFNAKVQQCQNLQNQIGRWKDRFRALQKSKDKQMEDLKLALQSQRKSVLDKEIRQLNIKFEAERAYLEGQIRKLSEAADQRQNQLTQAKYEAEALRIENQVNMDASRKLKESQNKLNRLTQELVRLNELLRRKQQQISRKDSNEQYLKQLIKTLERQKMNHQNQAIKVPQLEGAIKQWIVRFSRLENECNENGEKLQRVPVLERDIEHCTSEIERLSMIIKGKMNEVNEANNRADKFRSLYEESKKSEQKVPSLQRKITELGYQAQRCNDMLKKRLIEVEEGKNRILALEKALRVFQQAEPEKRRTEQQLKKQIREVEKHRKQIKDLQKQVEKIPQLEAVINDQRNIREEYTREVDRLNHVVKDKCQQNDTCNQKIEHLQNKVSELCNIEKELNGFRGQNNRLLQQIDNMNGKIRQKSQYLEQLASTVINLQENLEKYKIVEQKLIQNIKNTQKIMGELEHTKSQLQNCEQNLLQCESGLNQAKNTILDINNDRDMLNRNLNIKTQELEQAQSQINACLEQISQLREIQRCYHALQEDMRVLQGKLRQTEDSLKKERVRNDELEYHRQMLTAEIEKMKVNGYFPEEFRVMFREIKTNAQQKDRELQNLQKKQAMMDKSAQDIHGMISNICSTMQVRNGEWTQINKKIQDSVRNVSKINELQDENAELRTQNLELQSQIKMLNLEIMQAKVRATTVTSGNQGNQFVAPPLSAAGSSTTSWSFNTVPSKKAIDSIVEDQGASRVSTLSNHKRVLSSTQNIMNINTNTNSTSKSKLDEINSSSRLSSQNFTKSNPTASQTYQFNQNPSNASLHNSRGISPSIINSYLPPPKVSSTSKQATETYFTMKTSKTSSVREPYTFKSSYRA